MHVGSLDSGHYYVYCKRRVNGEIKWVEFNDEDVKIWNEEIILSNA